jgi:hypothetical protein
MDVMETNLEKLFQPQRLKDESMEDYILRRKTAHKFNKMNARGVMKHQSVWYEQTTNKAGEPTMTRYSKTYVKPQEN